MKSPAAQTPRFGYLVRLALESLGVHYVSIDLLRKAKKNQTTEIEYWTLWRLLHDLVLAVLVDFEVDTQAMERLNAAEALEIALLDSELHVVQMELVRFYLYEWGFVCSAFYTSARPSSQLLLLAFAWSVACSRLFERKKLYILERSTGTKQPRLPPFPNDIDLEPEIVAAAATDAVSSSLKHEDKVLPADAQMHRLHSAFGRLLGHLSELEAYTRYHERLVHRLESMQNKAEDHKDGLIPAFVLNLLTEPTSRLADQVRVLAQSVQMIEDEALFYKWINGLVLSLNKSSEGLDAKTESVASPTGVSHAALRAHIQEIQSLFQEHAESFKQIEQGYQEEWKKWTSRQKSRSRVQQMETKMERFVHEVQTQELFDPQKLFLRSERSWSAQRIDIPNNNANPTHLATKEDVDHLQSQIKTVIGEITHEFCGVQLR
ncbi:hypothetical protein PHYBOEH_002748 [Phytophthora boehmeriae]|uniref:Tubulin epsilon and delta complex protein 1 domain-containing protein n=1 Tax=Phytophthora boehmeriae TaxID=109152 RepID=A0A8T1WU12_9STRA|nr:hypothetical protein PHYBOEH_002748 [Phytophthora boehmeriae]